MVINPTERNRTMAQYKKKPIIIEARQWHDEEYGNYPSNDIRSSVKSAAGRFIIETLEGNHLVSDGDWIIKGVEGELYPCKPNIFEQTYDKVE